MSTNMIHGIWAACLCAVSAHAGTIVTTLTSANDGSSGSDRYGFSYGWEASGFDSTAPTIWCGHWYDGGSATGSIRNAYLQVDLSALPTDPADIVSATLWLYVDSFDNGTVPAATLKHVVSTTANGNASQVLATGVGTSHSITDLSTGWRSFEFTTDVLSDLALGCDYSAFMMAQSSYRGLTFRSADYADAAFRPYLSVVTLTVPEPANFTILLSILGAAGMVMRKRSR